MSLSAYYLALMDALNPICPDCLFLVEGTGGGNLAANWGAHSLWFALKIVPLHKRLG